MEEKTVCSYCGTEQPENANFCFNCGEPLTNKAKDVLEKQKRNYQLELILKLIDKIDDKKTLVLLKKIAEELSQK